MVLVPLLNNVNQNNIHALLAKRHVKPELIYIVTDTFNMAVEESCKKYHGRMSKPLGKMKIDIPLTQI